LQAQPLKVKALQDYLISWELIVTITYPLIPIPYLWTKPYLAKSFAKKYPPTSFMKTSWL
jgi:hypothetical protein